MSFYNKKPEDKANWLRPTVLSNGVTVSVSDKSGILKVQAPGAKFGMQAFTDDLMTFFAASIEIQRYIEQNQDICFSSGQRHEARKVKQVQMRNLAKAIELVKAINPNLGNDEIEALLKKQA